MTQQNDGERLDKVRALSRVIWVGTRMRLGLEDWDWGMRWEIVWEGEGDDEYGKDVTEVSRAGQGGCDDRVEEGFREEVGNGVE